MLIRIIECTRRANQQKMSGSFYKITVIYPIKAAEKEIVTKQFFTFIDLLVAKDVAGGCYYWLHFFYDLKQKWTRYIHL